MNFFPRLFINAPIIDSNKDQIELLKNKIDELEGVIVSMNGTMERLRYSVDDGNMFIINQFIKLREDVIKLHIPIEKSISPAGEKISKMMWWIKRYRKLKVKRWIMRFQKL